MVPARALISIVLFGAIAAAPATSEAQRRRPDGDRRGEQQQRDDRGERQRGGDRAVPRASVDERRNDSQRQLDAQRQAESQRQVEAQRQAEAQRQRDVQARRQADVQRQRDNERWRANDNRRNNGNWRGNGRAYGRPYYANRGWGPRTVIVPRYIRPRIVTVVPYRPYVYRPSIGLGVYYGTGGVYPFGYTPRGYYDPIPGRLYGGLRITDAPREAQVFADGYYVGIVNDFDGVFQHLNLEAGPHQIEIRLPGYEDAIQFDVYIEPGRTITYRADW